MNLLGMKRRLLPYGMPLGGALGAFGGSGQSSPTPSSGGGKSSGAGQGGYGSAPSFDGQSAAPTSAAPASGGKSSGLGSLGYGAAPSFGGQQPGGLPISGTGGELLGGAPTQSGFNQGVNQAGNAGSGLASFSGTFSPEAEAFQRANPQNAEANKMAQNAITGMQNDITKQTNNMQQNQGTPMQGGKSSGLGQGGYQSAPGFGQQQQGSPAQQLGQLGNLLRGQSLGGLASQRQMQGGFGPQAPTQDAFNGFRAMTGSPMNFDQFSQSRGSRFTQQPQQRFQQPQQNMQGIQDLFSRMMSQFQPQQTQQQMPQYRSPGLDYRPDYIRAQENLTRVKPSVQKQEQDAQAARIAELEEQLAGFQRPSDGGGGGGGG